MDRNESSEEDEEDIQWLRFDDLARERVKVIDIEKALKDESPYLLFYQVQPINEDLARGDPPSYSEATDAKEDDDFPSTNPSSESLVDVKKLLPVNTDERKAVDAAASTSDVKPSRISIELPDATPTNDRRGRSSMDERRRGSIVFIEKSSDNEDTKSSLTNASGSVTLVTTAPTTPADESKTSWLGSRRGSKASNSTPTSRSTKSRPTSQSGEGNRLSLTMSRLTGRISRDKLLNTNVGTGNQVADRDFAGRAPEKEDAAPVIEVAEVDPTRSRASTTTTTPANLTPAASSVALDKTAMLNQAATAASVSGKLEIAAPPTVERDSGHKSVEKKRDRSVNANASAGANTSARKSAELTRPKEKEKEKEKKVGSVMRSRSRHLEKKKAKNAGERPDRECVVM